MFGPAGRSFYQGFKILKFEKLKAPLFSGPRYSPVPGGGGSGIQMTSDKEIRLEMDFFCEIQSEMSSVESKLACNYYSWAKCENIFFFFFFFFKI